LPITDNLRRNNFGKRNTSTLEIWGTAQSEAARGAARQFGSWNSARSNATCRMTPKTVPYLTNGIALAYTTLNAHLELV